MVIIRFTFSYYPLGERVVKLPATLYTASEMKASNRIFRFGDHQSTVTFGGAEEAVGGERINGLLVCDSNTERLAGSLDLPKVVLEPGEEHKNWQGIERILNTAVGLGLGRDSRMVGLGGGVVCDMTAFAASVFMRGCRVTLVPTTLLAMVDASIGGKTGIDFSGYKNLVGSFYPADRIHISVETLSTLPERDYKSGLAEVIKHALLGADDLLALLEEEPGRFAAREAGAIEASISRSLDIKGDIVAQDFEEHGVRAYLNFGHTFGHALEAVAGFGVFSHGEAVAWGIARALTAGLITGITSRVYADRVFKLLQGYGYRTGALPEGVTAGQVMAAMKQDKKKRGGGLRFVLQRAHGETIVTALDDEIVLQALTVDQVS